MGLFWKKVNAMPKGCVVTIPGQIESPPKRWWNLWRRRQKWFVVKVKGRRACRVYFESKSQGVMVFRNPIEHRFIAVRVGPEQIEFLATDSWDRVLSIEIISGPHTRSDIRVMNDPVQAKHSAKLLQFFGENAIICI